MAVDMFLKIDGIKGESQDKKHKDEIDLSSWSWGASTGAHTRRAAAAVLARFRCKTFISR